VNDSNCYFKELSYRKLRSTTVLLEPNRDFGGFTSNGNTADTQSVASLHSQTSSTHHHSTQQDKLQVDNESGRLHDLHIADCSETHFYLLQPFEHATIAACSDCTIVVGAVAGLLHIVVSALKPSNRISLVLNADLVLHNAVGLRAHNNHCSCT
jgi:TBCC domain-containing protein 1